MMETPSSDFPALRAHVPFLPQCILGREGNNGPMMMTHKTDIQTDPQANYTYIIIDGQLDMMPL